MFLGLPYIHEQWRTCAPLLLLLVYSAIKCTCCKPTHNNLNNWSAAECNDRLVLTPPWHIDQGRSGQGSPASCYTTPDRCTTVWAALWTSWIVYSWKALIPSVHFGWDWCSLEVRPIMKVRMGDHFYLERNLILHVLNGVLCSISSSHSGPFIIDLVQ